MPKALFFGFNAPFFGGPSNVMSLQLDERLIKNDMLQLIMTAPGERIMRPTFGTAVRPSLFEGLDDASKRDIIDTIERQTLAHDDRVKLTEVSITDNGVDLINIKVYGTTTATPVQGNTATNLLVELNIPKNQLTSTLSTRQTSV